MKKILITLLSFITIQVALAQPPEGEANKGMIFGEKIEPTDAITTDELSQKLEDTKKLNVKVQGVVTQVCSKKGCWFKLKTANGDVMVKMKDYGFFVPISMQGKTVVAEGIAEKKVTSIKVLRHYAEDAGKTKEEIEAIKEPKVEILLQVSGIVVVE